MTEADGDDRLSSADLESIRAALRQLHQNGWRDEFHFSERLDSWASLVAQVEDGYDDLEFEYSNDLYVREWFDDLFPLITEHARACLAARLRPLDDRFMAATVPPERPFHGNGRWFQVPRRLIGHLREDFIRGRIVSA